MRSTILFCLQFSFLWSNCFAQNKPIVSSDAKITDPARSLLAYEYEIFLAQKNDLKKADAILKKSDVYKTMGAYEEAYHCLKRINTNYIISDSVLYKIGYETALNAYLGSKYQLAESEITNLKNSISDTLVSDQSWLLEVFIRNELHEWTEAKQILQRHLPNVNADSLYERIPKMKIPKIASIMSAILPGSGQLYSGYPLESLGSILFTGGSVAFGTLLFISGYPVTAIVAGGGLVTRFYVGGIKRAAYLAERKNFERSNKFNSAIKRKIFIFTQNSNK